METFKLSKTVFIGLKYDAESASLKRRPGLNLLIKGPELPASVILVVVIWFLNKHWPNLNF